MENNPVTQADPTSLNELFSRDPESLQQVDLEKIVTYFRDLRKKWDLAEASGKKSLSKKAAKEPLQPPPANLSIEDLL